MIFPHLFPKRTTNSYTIQHPQVSSHDKCQNSYTCTSPESKFQTFVISRPPLGRLGWDFLNGSGREMVQNRMQKKKRSRYRIWKLRYKLTVFRLRTADDRHDAAHVASLERYFL